MQRKKMWMFILLCFLEVKTRGANLDSLTLAFENPVKVLDPRYTSDADSQYIESLTHCSLVRFDESGKTVPHLAEKWNWENNLQLKMTLKKEVKFSDGNLVTGKDVLATYEYLRKKDLKQPSPRAAAFNLIKEIKLSGHEISFFLNEPDASFVTNLVIGVLPEKVAAIEPQNQAQPMTGCGPYQIAKSDMTGIDLEQNKFYAWGNEKGLKKISFKYVADETTRFAKLEKGELDLVQNLISRDKVKDLAKKPNLKIEKRSGLNTTYLGFNMKNPILANIKVRQAIAYGIQRDDIIKYILNGLATPATTLITPDSNFIDKNLKKYEFNPKLANELLDAAGYKDPDGPKGVKSRFKLSYKTTTNATALQVAKALSAQLKKIGIEVEVFSLEWGKFKSEVENGNVDLWSLRWIGFKDPDIFRFAFATESFTPNGGNRGWYSNTKLDKIMTEARQSIDENKRKELYLEVQKIVNEELPYVFLWHEDLFAVMNKKVDGFKLYADGRYDGLMQTRKK